MYGIRASTPDLAALVVAVFYGGMHAISLLLGLATIILSVAMKGEAYGKPIAYLVFATAVFDIIGAYPYTIGPILALASQVFLVVCVANLAQ